MSVRGTNSSGSFQPQRPHSSSQPVARKAEATCGLHLIAAIFGKRRSQQLYVECIVQGLVKIGLARSQGGFDRSEKI